MSEIKHIFNLSYERTIKKIILHNIDKALELLPFVAYYHHMENTHIEYPVRVNRYLYLLGYCSRRQADKYITEGKVKINGKTAEIGQKVEKTDKVVVDSKIESLPKNYKYFIYNKPAGIVSHSPQGNEKSVEDVFKTKVKVFPIGRLDKLSRGLMLLTNDGRIVDKLLNPKYPHEKEYSVRVDKVLKQGAINRMKRGVRIEGYMTKEAKVRMTGEKQMRIILTEGKKHQIRRMCAALGYQVKDLLRVRIMNLKIRNLPEGKGRELTEEEKTELLSII